MRIAAATRSHARRLTVERYRPRPPSPSGAPGTLTPALRGTNSGTSRTSGGRGAAHIDGAVMTTTPGAAQVPDKPALEGLEDKWAEVWEQSGIHRFSTPEGG